MLFLPAHVEKYVERAHTRGSDAYILDLEDSVPAGEKANARASLVAGVRLVTPGGAAALVRINADLSLRSADIEAASIAGVSAIVLPKVNDASDVADAALRLDALEARRGLAAGAIRLIAQIETSRR